jgi:hypothetical protein
MGAVDVFGALSTQWRYRPDGRLVGLDLAALAGLWSIYGIARKDRRRVLWGVQVMEQAVIKAAG